MRLLEVSATSLWDSLPVIQPVQRGAGVGHGDQALDMLLEALVRPQLKHGIVAKGSCLTPSVVWGWLTKDLCYP